MAACVRWNVGISGMAQMSNKEDLALECDGPYVILSGFLRFWSSLGNIDVCLFIIIKASKRYIVSTYCV
jgi:hypothetical protein